MKKKRDDFPQHIAIIMDGNRRWARNQGLAIIKGHRKVANEVIEQLADECILQGVPYLTMWAFSTENWHRDRSEVDAMMNLFREMLETSIDRLHQKEIRVRTIGDISEFAQDIQEKIAEGVEQTKNNTKLTLIFALNYGGRDELLRATRKIAEQVARGKLRPEDIYPETITNSLDTVGLPDPDMIIRPGGEKRLSGYLPWQGVYAELFFTDILMPDFGPQQLRDILDEYKARNRRFGK